MISKKKNCGVDVDVYSHNWVFYFLILFGSVLVRKRMGCVCVWGEYSVII